MPNRPLPAFCPHLSPSLHPRLRLRTGPISTWIRTGIVTLPLTSALMEPGASSALAEDGYRLWLRYALLADDAQREAVLGALGEIVLATPSGVESPTLAAARDELAAGLGGLLGAVPPIRIERLANPVEDTGEEGYSLRAVGVDGKRSFEIAAISQILEGSGLAGIQQNQTLIGAWAVELLVSRIMSQDFGIPLHPRIEMAESEWIDGPSLEAPAEVVSDHGAEPRRAAPVARHQAPAPSPSAAQVA